MANPANITITECVANGSVARPAVQTVDTDGTINCLVGGKMDRFIVELVNAAAAALTVTFKAGTSAAAHQAKDLAVALTATGGATPAKIVGPLEASQFMKADGSIDITFLAASSTPNCTVRAYRLPKHVV